MIIGKYRTNDRMKKRMTILGGGESGAGAAVLAVQLGYRVFLSDAKKLSDPVRRELVSLGVDFEEGTHTLEKVLDADLVVKSPGIPVDAPVIQSVRDAGVELIGEIEFAYRHRGQGKIIAITGTNGKTTTTTFLGQIFEASGESYAVAGNIGYSFARAVAAGPKDFYILEISSFQLDDIVSFNPQISVITNIAADHLDRYHHQFKKYIESKFRIIQNQQPGDVLIYNYDDPVTTSHLKQFINDVKAVPFSMNIQLPEGAYVENAEMHLRWRNEDVRMSIEDFQVTGKHNLRNAMAASLAAKVSGIRSERIRSSMTTVSNLPHRQQFVATIKGVDFINDSKSTNENSVWDALTNMERPVVLIMGGVDKGLNFEGLRPEMQERVKGLVLLGTDNSKLVKTFSDCVPQIAETRSMKEAVSAAFNMAEKGDVVLLSPGCASFDLFENYEDRGNQFMHEVKQL